MATRPAFPPRHPPEPSVALKYSASGHLRVRSMHFYAADYLFPVPVPPSPLSRLHPRCSNLSLAGLWIHGRRDFRDRYPRRGSGIKAARSPRDCSLRLSFLRRYIGRTGFFVTTGELFAGRRDHLQTRPTRRTNDKKKGRTDSCRLTRGSLF